MDFARELLILGGSHPPVSSGGGGFSPSSLPNLVGWYKADIGVTGTTSITAIADNSGHGNNLAVHNAAGGIIALNNAGYTGNKGSKPAFMFDNSQTGSGIVAAFATGVSVAGSVTLPATGVWTAWAIGQGTTLTAGFGSLLATGQGATGSSGTATDMADFISNDGASQMDCGIGNYFAFGTVSKATNHTFITTYDGTTITFYLDGAALPNTGAPPTAHNQASPTNIILGCGWGSGALDFNCWDGAICEAGVAMSYAATNVGNLHGYLIGKWGL